MIRQLPGVKLKRVFLDIETSMCEGRFWRIGSKVNLGPENITKEAQIICICYKWQEEKEVHALTWDENQDTTNMLKEFVEVLNQADEIVAHNGKAFDLKWVLWEMLKHRVPAFPTYKMVDTLSLMRSKFRAPCNRLNYLCQVLFGKEKAETGGLQLWHDVMDGDKKALKRMVSYCKQDVLLLEELFLLIEDYAPQYTHVGVLEGNPKWTCPKCGSNRVHSRGPSVTAAGTMRYKCQCQTCSRYFLISNLARKQMIETKMEK